MRKAETWRMTTESTGVGPTAWAAKLCNKHEEWIWREPLLLTRKRGSCELEITGRIPGAFFSSPRTALWTVPAVKPCWCDEDVTVATVAWVHKTPRRKTASLAKGTRKRGPWGPKCAGGIPVIFFLPLFSCWFTPRADAVTQKCARFYGEKPIFLARGTKKTAPSRTRECGKIPGKRRLRRRSSNSTL